MDNADAVVAAMQARPNSLRYNKKRLALQAIGCDEVVVASMAVSESVGAILDEASEDGFVIVRSEAMRHRE